MPTPNDTSSLARFQEVTSGTGPANAAAWVAGSTRMRHIMGSLDTSGFEQATIVDERSQEDVQGSEQTILAIKGGVEFPFDAYFTGLGETTADGDTWTADELHDHLQHCMGGAYITPSTTATGGSTTTAILDDATGMVLGAYVGVELAARPGVVLPRRIVDIATLTVTFDQALPSAVASGDLIHSAATYYFDEDALNDSGIGPTTAAWLLTQGRGTAREHWGAYGCKSWIDSISLGRNAAPRLAFKTKVARFDTPDDLSDPSFSAIPEGDAPVAVGPSTQLWVEDYGTTTNTQRHAVEFSVKPGGAPAPCETLTEQTDGMPGIAHYGLTRDDSTAELKTLFSQAEFDDFTNGQLKTVRWSRNSTAGRTIAVAMHRCEFPKTPKSTGVGPSLGQDLSLRALQDTTDVATTDLWRSRLVLVRI